MKTIIMMLQRIKIALRIIRYGEPVRKPDGYREAIEFLRQAGGAISFLKPTGNCPEIISMFLHPDGPYGPCKSVDYCPNVFLEAVDKAKRFYQAYRLEHPEDSHAPQS
jgi:hypothetical protein